MFIKYNSRILVFAGEQLRSRMCLALYYYNSMPLYMYVRSDHTVSIHAGEEWYNGTMHTNVRIVLPHSAMDSKYHTAF